MIPIAKNKNKKSPSLVLIRLVLTEIQGVKNATINKEMYGHPDAVFRQILAFSSGCILLTIAPIYDKLGDFVKLGLHFMTIWINSC